MIDQPFLLASRSLRVNDASLQLPSSPAVNLTNDNMDMAWRSFNLNAPYVVLECSGVVDTIGILHSNGRAGDTVRVRAANSVTEALTAPVWDSGELPAYVGALREPYTPKTLVDVPSVTATYWRFDFTFPSHPAGQVEVSRIVMGERFVIGSGIDYEWTKGLIDDSPITTGPNYEDVQEYISRPRVKATFGQMDEPMFNELDAFMMRVGTKQPVLFAPEPDNLDSVQQWTVYGRVKVLFEGMNLFHNLWESDIEVVGLKA
jgi:hypothetical protein